MPLITPDFSEVTEGKPIPPGTYPARITDCEQRTGKQSGNPYLNWKLELFGSPEVNNRVIYTMTMMSGPGAFRLQELYKAATGEELKPKQAFDTDQLLGKEVTVTLVPEKDQNGNDRTFPAVKTVTPYRAN